MKKIFVLLTVLCCANVVFANDFKTFYDNGQNYLNSSQYSNAITEFKKALRINYLDNSARIGLINSYLARATSYLTLLLKLLECSDFRFVFFCYKSLHKIHITYLTI